MKRMSIAEMHKVLKNKSVGIAGAGGLGSNCAVALARVGVGKLVVADFDVVSESNLNRQYYFKDQVGLKKVDALKTNIHRINAGIKVDVHDIKLDAGYIVELYHSCDVLVEAFDRADQKVMLLETMLEKFPEKSVVSGVGMAGFGESNAISAIQYDNLYICGDGVNEVSDDLPPLAPRVGIVANMQANEVLKILLSE